MNWQFLYQKAVNILLGIMTTSAVFVEMVAIFCFVMDALGPFTEVKLGFLLYLIYQLYLLACFSLV